MNFKRQGIQKYCKRKNETTDRDNWMAGKCDIGYFLSRTFFEIISCPISKNSKGVAGAES